MNTKTLLIKIVEYIYKANIKYEESNYGDIILLFLIMFSFVFGKIFIFMFILLWTILRCTYKFDVLERLGVIYEEEKKKDDDQNSENIR